MWTWLRNSEHPVLRGRSELNGPVRARSRRQARGARGRTIPGGAAPGRSGAKLPTTGRRWPSSKSRAERSRSCASENDRGRCRKSARAVLGDPREKHDLVLVLSPRRQARSSRLTELKKKKIAVIGVGDNSVAFVRRALEISDRPWTLRRRCAEHRRRSTSWQPALGFSLQAP